MIAITLPGIPRGKGRPRFARQGKFVRTYTDDQTASYEGALRLAAAAAMAGAEPMPCPVKIEMVATFPIPASWSKVKKERAEYGALRPTGKPDCDNLLKCVDAFNGIVWRDDAQVVTATVKKLYGVAPGLIVRVEAA